MAKNNGKKMFKNNKNTMKLSVSMIVKNEEEMIAKCLETVKTADELIIVDTGSKDSTVEICKRYGRVLHKAWKDDFAEARNYSLIKCTGDWVLIIDADEELNESIEELKTYLETLDDKVLAVAFVVSTDLETFNQIRVFRNGAGIKWVGAIHNSLVLNGHNLWPVSVQSKFTLKSGYSPAHEKDPDRTLRILKKQLSKEPNNTRYLYYIAREYLNRKDGDAALPHLRKYFDIAFYKPWSNELADVCYLMSTVYVNRKDWHMAASSAITAVLILPTFKAPMELLHELFKLVQSNGPVKPSEYWRLRADEANNEGVLFIR